MKAEVKYLVKWIEDIQEWVGMNELFTKGSSIRASDSLLKKLPEQKKLIKEIKKRIGQIMVNEVEKEGNLKNVEQYQKIINGSDILNEKELEKLFNKRQKARDASPLPSSDRG
jgi:hypothetical protein